MRIAKRLAIIFTVVLLVGSAAEPAGATVPVYDYVRWIQDFVQRTYAQYQRVEQIYRAYQQVVAAYKNLESWGHDGEWHNLSGVYDALHQVQNTENTLGYATNNLDRLLDETFPGWATPTDYPTDQELRLRRAIATMKNLTNTIDHVGRPNVKSQLRLLLAQARSGRSDGALKAIQASNVFASLQEEDQGRTTQGQLASANALAISQAYDLQEEAAGEAAFNAWLTKDPTSQPLEPGVGIVPAGWPY